MHVKNKKVIDWLLEDNNPPVKYLTLTHLLKKKSADSLVRSAKEILMTYSVTEKILQHRQEFSTTDNKAYWKYTGLYWQIIFLGQFLADGYDQRIAPIIDKLLQNRHWVSQRGGHCLTANLLTAFMQLGYAEHDTVNSEVISLAQRYLQDRGIACTAMDYSLLHRCYMALPKLLLCFTHSQSIRRSSVVSEAIELICAEMIRYNVYKYVPEHKKYWNKILESVPDKKQMPGGTTVKSWIADRRRHFIEQNGFGQHLAK